MQKRKIKQRWKFCCKTPVQLFSSSAQGCFWSVAIDLTHALVCFSLCLLLLLYWFYCDQIFSFATVLLVYPADSVLAVNNIMFNNDRHLLEFFSLSWATDDKNLFDKAIYCLVFFDPSLIIQILNPPNYVMK